MPIPADTPGTKLFNHAAHRVYVRERWADDWILASYTFCQTCEQTCAPALPSAELEYRVGSILQHDVSGFDTYVLDDALDWYVKIEIDQLDANGDPTDPIRWYGIIVEQLVADDGALLIGGVGVQRGTVTLKCSGLEILLRRLLVDKSWVMDQANNSNSELEINRAREFNPHTRLESYGNASSVRGQRGAYLFTNRGEWLSTVVVAWSSYNIALYLLQYFVNFHVPFNVEFSALANQMLDGLTGEEPRLKADGKNVWQLFNEIFDRRKLLTWRLRVDETNEQFVYLDVFVFQSSDITLSGGQVRRGNPDQVALEYDRDLDIGASQVGDQAANRYDEVLVRGARTISVASWSYADGTLEAGWETADQTAYNDGPDLTGVTDDSEKERKVREYRSVDALEPVYSWFRIPKAFVGTQQVGDGIGGALKSLLPAADFPAGVDAGFNPSSTLVDLFEMRFMSRLPFIEGKEVFDSQGSHLAVFLRTPENAASVRPWVHGERTADLAATEFSGNEAGRKYACGCAPLPDRPGVRVRLHGAPPHTIAASEFVAIAAANDDPAQLDWHGDLIVTAAVELDQYCQGSHHDVGNPNPDVVRRLIIDAGEKYQQVYVVEGTVMRANDGALERSAGGYLRDDRLTLTDLATIAWNWHAVPRRQLKLVYKQLLRPVRVGQIVSTIGGGVLPANEINALVTGVVWNVADGTTEIKTDFADLDLSVF